jgi:hypothetical protein
MQSYQTLAHSYSRLMVNKYASKMYFEHSAHLLKYRLISFDCCWIGICILKAEWGAWNTY